MSLTNTRLRLAVLPLFRQKGKAFWRGKGAHGRFFAVYG
jgi:hypothetical protein